MGTVELNELKMDENIRYKIIVSIDTDKIGTRTTFLVLGLSI